MLPKYLNSLLGQYLFFLASCDFYSILRIVDKMYRCVSPPKSSRLFYDRPCLEKRPQRRDEKIRRRVLFFFFSQSTRFHVSITSYQLRYIDALRGTGEKKNNQSTIRKITTVRVCRTIARLMTGII